ncbi:MAG: aromatic-ring-hydroxylating dioxygenase subunit beta [Caulobacteraceae bacterium]
METAIKEAIASVPVGSADYNAVLEWLYREARMLDTGRFEAWLALMAPDVVYEMPSRQSVLPKDGDGFRPEMGFFAENHASLASRVARLQTEQAWAEQPGSRSRHIVSNLLVDRLDGERLAATTSFVITRSRADLPYDVFTGERRDVLRRDGDSFKLVRRLVLLDQTVLKSHNLSIFF